ncbi:MAG: SulP family inorganic anion transporter, partial [Pseudomonadota bacterium]
LTIVLWNKFKPKALALLPGPLLGVIAGTVFALAFSLPITLVELPSDLTAALNIPTSEALGGFLDPSIIGLGLVFAFVASAETLLCATAVDKMHTGARTNYDKELRAQGIGNMICGAVGALPMTGVIVRSSANVEAGALTRTSAILHGVWLLLAVAAFPFILNAIPTSVLAGILVYTGYKLVNITQIRKIAEFGKQELAIYFATLIGVVAIDLLTGVIIGFVLATLKLVYTFSHLKIDTTHDEETGRVDFWMTGSATFFSIPQLSNALEATPRGAEVHIHVEHLDYIDHACLEMLSSWESQHRSTGGSMIVEWSDLVERYSRRSSDPANAQIQSLSSRSAA